MKKKAKWLVRQIVWAYKNINQPDRLIEYAVWERRKTLGQILGDRLSNVVARGPFRGLKMPDKFSWGETDLASQLLGLYEQEVLAEIVSSPERKTLLNLGAAEGYYAIGWVLSKPGRNTIAFEIDPIGQTVISNTAILNKVESRVKILGAATSQELLNLNLHSSVFPKDLLILSDIEGAEYEILTEEVLEKFKGAKWIIEVHEFNLDMRESLIKFILIAERFYTVRTILSGMRNPNAIEELVEFTDVDRWLICAEGRSGMPGKWLVLE